MTIFALSSAPGRAGVAVIRISGPEAGPALAALSHRSLPPPRSARLVRLLHPADGRPLDRALVLWFPAPASFTGEDVAELHVHGGPAVVAAFLDALNTMPRLRPAEAGEFARRAFENGKLDLTEIEGLADLVAAETEAQRAQALRQMEGALGQLYENWRARLLRALAHAEATIDFVDEEDVPADLLAQIYPEMADLRAEIAAHLADAHRGERLREGMTLVIIGAPNAGKSTLLNALARREAAIVSAEAGTTRDVIEVRLDLDGLPLVVIDTAGLRMAESAIEAEGIRRARARAARADLKLALFNATRWPDIDAETAALVDEDSVALWTKADLLPPEHPLRAEVGQVGGQAARLLSVASGAGMAELLADLTARLRSRLAPSEAPALTRLRHRRAVEETLAALGRFLQGDADLAELAVEDLRLSVRALGRITGRVDVEDVLDLIFRDFCIGK